MKWVKQCLLLLCTLALAALGAAMPWLAAWLQDGRTGALQEEFDLDALSLTLRQDSQAADTLRLLGGNHTMLGWEGETAMQIGDIRMAAYDASKQLVGAGLMDGDYALQSSSGGGVAPLLALSEDGSLSAIIWYISWGEGSGCHFMMDDATGKLVGGSFQRSGRLSVPEFNQQLIDWVGFCGDYYGVGAEVTGWDGGNPVVKDEVLGGSTFVMTLRPGQGAPVELRLAFYEMTVEFNAPKEPTDASSMGKG